MTRCSGWSSMHVRITGRSDVCDAADRSPSTGVNKSYTRRGAARVAVLRGLSLAVEKGEMVAIVGASGVGQEHAAPRARRARQHRRRVVRIGDADSARDAPRRSSRRSATGTSASSFSSIICCPSSPRSRTRACRCGSPRRRRTSATVERRALLERVGLGERLAHNPACCRAASSSASRSRARWS